MSSLPIQDRVTLRLARGFYEGNFEYCVYEPERQGFRIALLAHARAAVISAGPLPGKVLAVLRDEFLNHHSGMTVASLLDLIPDEGLLPSDLYDHDYDTGILYDLREEGKVDFQWNPNEEPQDLYVTPVHNMDNIWDGV